MLTKRIHTLENYAMSSGRTVPTFQTKLLYTSFTLMMEPAGFAEMSVHFCCAIIHSATSETTAIFIVTAVRISNLTKYCHWFLAAFDVSVSLLGSSQIVC